MDKQDEMAEAYNDWRPTYYGTSLRAAFFAGWRSAETAPNRLVIDTTNAQITTTPTAATAPAPMWMQNRDRWLAQGWNDMHSYHGFKPGPFPGCNAGGDLKCGLSPDEHCQCGSGDHVPPPPTEPPPCFYCKGQASSLVPCPECG